MPKKSITVARLKDPEKPGRRIKRNGHHVGLSRCDGRSSVDGGNMDFQTGPHARRDRARFSSQSTRGSHVWLHSRPALLPVPRRCEDGAVKFPCGGDGHYFRDEVLGGFAWFDGHGPKHEIAAGWFFIPADPDKRPFADIARLFEVRAQIMKENEKDARGHNLKVSYNSAYGKLAQSVRRKGHPPKFASPWLAGAITARTRRLGAQAR